MYYGLGSTLAATASPVEEDPNPLVGDVVRRQVVLRVERWVHHGHGALRENDRQLQRLVCAWRE
jgi:hypothetical protein